jgi:hypothetical protein
MSCENTVNKVTHFARRIGLPRLAARNVYYAGLAAGAVGLLAAAMTTVPRFSRAIANRRARAERQASAGPPQGEKSGEPEPASPRQVPALPARTRVMPATPDILSGKSCANCNALPQSKPGMWYVIDGQAHCQDCAPRAARQADVDLAVTPPPTPAGASTGGGYRGDRWVTPALVLERLKDIRLEERTVEISTSEGRVRVSKNAYFVYKQNGVGTGLAITPLVESDGMGNFIINQKGWNITHLDSGMIMAGPFGHINEARGLAALLADNDWRRPSDRLSEREVATARQIVQDYKDALAEAKTRAGDRALSGGEMQLADLFGPR